MLVANTQGWFGHDAAHLPLHGLKIKLNYVDKYYILRK
jgi:hypothetical protein